MSSHLGNSDRIDDKVTVHLWTDGFPSNDYAELSRAFTEEAQRRGIDKKDAWFAFQDHPHSQFDERYGAYLLEIALTVPASVVGAIVYDLLKHSFTSLLKCGFKYRDQADLVKSIEAAQQKGLAASKQSLRASKSGAKARRKK